MFIVTRIKKAKYMSVLLLAMLLVVGCQPVRPKTQDQSTTSTASEETVSPSSASSEGSQASEESSEPATAEVSEASTEAVTSSESTSESTSEEIASSEMPSSEEVSSEASTSASSEIEVSESEASSSEVVVKPNEQEETSLAVYYLKDDGTDVHIVREVHSTPKTNGVAKAALEELIHGKVQTKDAFHPLPPNTKILGITIDKGLCIVDFSKEVLDMNIGAGGEAAAIQAITNTLTEFPTIKTVEFWVEGSKQKANNWWGHVGLADIDLVRDLSNVWEPAIWIQKPFANEAVGLSIYAVGSMMTFESTAGYRVVDANGKSLAEGTIQGNDHQGMRSFFDFMITIQKPQTKTGALQMFEFSGMDNSEINVVEVPLTFK